MLICFILVVSIQFLSSNVAPEAVFYGSILLDTELQRVEDLFSGRLILDIDALDHVLEFAFEKVLIGSLHFGALHLLLEFLTENAVELVDVLLLVSLVHVPAKGTK